MGQQNSDAAIVVHVVDHVLQEGQVCLSLGRQHAGAGEAGVIFEGFFACGVLCGIRRIFYDF